MPAGGPVPYRYGFGTAAHEPTAYDLSEPVRFLALLEELGIFLVNLTAGSPYYNPHIQRPALFPPSDGYQPPEDPLVGVARQVDVVRHAHQRILRRLIAVRRREQGRSLNVRVVVGAAGGQVDQEDAQLLKQGEEADGLGQVVGGGFVRRGSEPVSVRNGAAGGHPDPAVAARFEGDQIEGAEPDGDQQLGRAASQSGNHLAQKSGAVLEAAAVGSGPDCDAARPSC